MHIPSRPGACAIAATLAFAAACSSSDSNTPQAPESSGGSGASSGAANGGATGAAPGSGGAVGAGGSGGAPSSGGATMGSGASGGTGTGGTAAGGSGGLPTGSGGAGSGGVPQPTTCLGKPMPPRAYTRLDPPAALTPYFPTTTFKTATPAEAGMDAAKLTAALQFAPPHTKTQGIVVFRNGHIVGERYVAPFAQETRHESYSVAKGFSSALVGIAIRDGLLPGVDTPICGYYPEWGCDASSGRSRITIEHTMNVETGLKWSEDWRIGATAQNDAFSLTILDTALSRQVVDEPGTKQRYSTGDPALLTGVLQKAAGKTAFEYAKTVLFGPIGLSGVSWGSDSKGRTTTHMGISATAREFAKFGILYLNRGKWDGKQVVPADWVDFTTQAVEPCREQYRYLWHVNPPLRLGDADPNCSGFLECDPTGLADLPASGYFALGVYGQMIAVLPSAGLVIARVGQDEAGSEYWDGYVKDVIGLVLDAVI